MADMTLGQVLDWLNNCAISNTPSSDISNEFLGELADAINAAIKQREQDAKDAEAMARRFHEAYERLAPQFGYKTRTETRQFNPDSPNGKLMIAVCAAMAKESGR